MLTRRNTVDNGSANWISVGDVKLKFVKNYVDLPSLKLKNAIHFSACSYSGPIALAYSHSTTSWFISIWMSSGLSLKERIEVPDVFTVEWTKGHRLLVIDRRGNSFLYSSLGELVSNFHFSSNIREVRDVRVFTTTHDSGVAVLDDQMRVFIVNSVNEPIVWSMHNR
uniref:Vps16_N domain-containing protein n=1 Tax=Heterorhabditis bacteriophora TaxID=37862 RepID=A0A1I7XT48_HETBA